MYAEPPNNTKFKPGQSGNPNGRPKKLNDQDLLQILQQIIALYTAAQSKNQAIRHQAYKKIEDCKKVLFIK